MVKKKLKKTSQTIIIDIDVNISLWNAIKLRIAGLSKMNNRHSYYVSDGPTTEEPED